MDVETPARKPYEPPMLAEAGGYTESTEGWGSRNYENYGMFAWNSDSG